MEPLWIVSLESGLTQWYGHVQLLRNLVVGQWFAVRREDGAIQWESHHPRANTIRAVSEEYGVIIASEMRSDGPWTADFGCYAIALETGQLLWSNHGSGARRWVFRLLDFVPGFTNELRDTPRAIRGTQCISDSGRALDLLTGKPVGHLTDAEMAALRTEKPQTDAECLYRRGEVELSEYGIRLSNHTREGEDHVRYVRGALRMTGTGPDGIERWGFDIQSTGYHIDGNYFSYRLTPPYVYLVVSEDKQRIPHPKKAHYVQPNPTTYRLLTLDVRNGRILQDERICDSQCESARIEDVDDRGLLISTNGKTIYYFDRSG